MTISKLAAGAAMLATMTVAPALLAASDTNIKGVESAKMSLSEAVMAAQKEDSGKAIFAKYDTADGAGNYLVTVVTAAGKKDDVKVDPMTGQATKASVSNSGSTSRAGAQTIEQAKLGLTDAIQKAEMNGGKAMRATLDTEKGKTAYKVDLAQGDKSHTVWIDANSGSLLSRSS